MTLKFKMRKRFGTAAATPGQNWKQKSVGHGTPSLAIDHSRILNTFMVALLPCWFQQKTYPARTHTENTKRVENTNFCESFFIVFTVEVCRFFFGRGKNHFLPRTRRVGATHRALGAWTAERGSALWDLWDSWDSWDRGTGLKQILDVKRRGKSKTCRWPVINMFHMFWTGNIK